MPHIIVWNVHPDDARQTRLDSLKRKLVDAVLGMSELKLTKNDILVNIVADFRTSRPPDEMPEIMIQISEFWDKPERTELVRQKFAKALGTAAETQFPRTTVAVRLDPPFKPSDGFWTNKK